eukprot:1155839-Pelagomonas_calceolata.AAC.29
MAQRAKSLPHHRRAAPGHQSSTRSGQHGAFVQLTRRKHVSHRSQALTLAGWGLVPQCSLFTEQILVGSVGECVWHADTNLANPRTSAWFMKYLRRDALLGSAELNRCWNCTILRRAIQENVLFVKMVWTA